MLLRKVRQSRLQRRPFLVQSRFVGVVVARPRNETQYFAVLERSSEYHFLSLETSTSLPLPKEKPLDWSRLNYDASS